MAARRLALLLATASLALVVAAPASAEIYRWTDDAGREHFTMDLHRVPPKHRGEAERKAALEKARVDSEPSRMNTMETPDNARVKRWTRPRYSRTPASAGEPSCSAADRSKAQQLRRQVETWEKKLELQEDLESRLVRTKDRLRAENRVERYEIHLESAQQALEDFEDRMRRKGVPPGCYR
jgi:hypothetical protein